MRRCITIAAMAAGIVAGPAASAHAAPGGGAGQYTFPMVCDGEVVTLTIASGGWSAAHVRETGQRLVPKGTEFTVTDPATGEVWYEESDMKPSAEKKAGSTCVDAWEDEGALLTFTVHGNLK